ncbi:MAG: Rad3-related DNA helicase [Bacillariaceae sp.]|jgi:Rad3-related DNA helicase
MSSKANKEHKKTSSSSSSSSSSSLLEYPTSKSVPFPFPTGPYKQQAALMDTLLDGIPRNNVHNRNRQNNNENDKNENENENENENDNDTSASTTTTTTTSATKTRILALESPTGTGKSLSLACAGLAWLEYEESLYYNNNNNDNDDDNDDNDVNVNDHNKANTVISPTSVVNTTATTATATTTTTSTGIDWLDSWQPTHDNNDNKKEQKQQAAHERDKERHMKLVEKLNELRDQLHPRTPSSLSLSLSSSLSSNPQKQQNQQEQKRQIESRRENMLRMALTKSRMDERKRLKKRKRNANNNPMNMKKVTLAYEEEDNESSDSSNDYNNYNTSNSKLKKKKNKNFIPGTAEWLLQRQQQSQSQQQSQQQHLSSSGPDTVTTDTTTAKSILLVPPPQILYAARTHSQLSQFVQEIRKTKWGKTLRVVALGSRGQGLCGEFSATNAKKKFVSESMLTEACLDLRKSSKKCSHYVNNESIATLALHGLVEATDLEDFAKLGKTNKTCSYYATRMSIPIAQLIVLPYSLLCSKKSRISLGLQIHSNTLVLVDEAHNLPDAISNLSSVTITKSMTVKAQQQLDNYLIRYVDKLSSSNLRLLGQLKLLIRGLISSMTTTSGGGNNKKKQRQFEQNQQQQSEQQKQRYLLSSSQFLVSQRLETINLFPVLRYMEESKLSQKLLGFMTPSSKSSSTKMEGDMKKKGNDYENGDNKADNVSVTSHISPMSVVETFLEKLTYANDDDGQVVIDKGTEYYGGGEGSTVDNNNNNNNNNNDNSTTSSSYEKEPQLRFCVLNPAVQARDELWTSPRAVALVGGTLQPLDVMMRELVPGNIATHAATAQSMWTNNVNNINNHQQQQKQQQKRKITTTATIRNPYLNKNRHVDVATNNNIVLLSEPVTTTSNRSSHRLYRSDDFWAFTCGHVVDPSYVLLQSLTKVDGVNIDVRHKTRSTQAVTTAIGKALVRLCQSVPHGVVVFLPSYKYEAILVDAWKKRTTTTGTNSPIKSIWNQLEETTTVIREPKQASQVESTLTRYSRNATKSSRGALLLSVVGGKLSEGINFADDLCRCVVVVGLPFADRSDPLLQEKLKLVANASSGNDNSNSNSNMLQSTAARDYYRSLCLRAVNQSVGRAIRHAKDSATIVLMDERYLADEAIARGLPSWLTDSTPSWRRESGDLNSVIHRTEAFFATRTSS